MGNLMQLVTSCGFVAQQFQMDKQGIILSIKDLFKVIVIQFIEFRTLNEETSGTL